MNLRNYGDPYSIGSTGIYTWGSFEQVYSNWSVPYTVTQEQYGKDSTKVGYCVYLGWPVIKAANKSYLDDLDARGKDHNYTSWIHEFRLANHDGHKQRIECEFDAQFNNLAKSIAYALSGLNGKYNNCEKQNLIWNSQIWVDHGADAAVQGSTTTPTVIDTTGSNYSLHYSDASVGETCSKAKLVRAQQYATWAYQILGSDNTLDLQLSPSKENEYEDDSSKRLHVEADQATLSYWVGPYKLDLTDTVRGSVINYNFAAEQTTQTLGDMLYKEIIKRNYGQTSDNTFIKTRFRLVAEYTDETSDEVEVNTNADGTIAKQTNASCRIVLTDSSGKALPYGIPKFGDQFYIRYYVSDPMKTLKYITPKIEISYLGNSLAAAGIRVKSTKVSYSVHFSVCNGQNKKVNHYIMDKGYSNFSLGDSPEHGQLVEAFFYDSNRSHRADIAEGIAALEQMVKESNFGSKTSPKVTWYDYTGGWDHVEREYRAHYHYSLEKMCDGIYLDECDLVFTQGGYSTVSHKNFMFTPEFDHVNDLYNCLIHNWAYYMTLKSDKNGALATGEIWEAYDKADKFDVGTVNGHKFSSTWINDADKTISSNCGCSRTEDNKYCPLKGEHECCGPDSCGDCGCNKPAKYGTIGSCGEDDDCDDEPLCSCEEDDEYCDCGDSYLISAAEYCECKCSCKYRYDTCTLYIYKTHYFRDYVKKAGGPQVVKQIGPETEAIRIKASGYSYDTKQDALNALETKVNEELRKIQSARQKKLYDWYKDHSFPALYVPYGFENEAYTMPFIEENDQYQMQKVMYNVHLTSNTTWKSGNYDFTKKEINEYLGGNVSEAMQGITSRAGIQKDDVWQGAGIEVALIDLGPQGKQAKPVPPTKPTPVEPIPAPQVPQKPQVPEQENMTDEQYEILLDQYNNVDKPAYDAAMEEYNRLKDLYDKNQTAYRSYQNALTKYNEDLQKYQRELTNWKRNVNLPDIKKVVKVTLTDENGNYGFQRLNPLHTYKVQFRYDGLEYIDDLGNPISKNEATEISDNIKSRNTAAEIDYYSESLTDDPRSKVQGRDTVNDMFEKIDASNINYVENSKNTPRNNKAYGWYTKLRGNGAQFIEYNNQELENAGGLDNNVGAMRFVDAYYLFKKNAVDNAPKIKQGNVQEMMATYVDIEKGRTITYDDIIKRNLPGILDSNGVSKNVVEHNVEHNGMDSYDETIQVSNFIYDSLVVAETKINFPDNGPVKFFLEDVGTGNTNDTNNKKVNNTDKHNNYNHSVAENPFSANTKIRVNSLYNNENTNNGQTINNRDQARNVDLRIKRRDEANLVVAMDLAQVTLTVNGQKEIYKYGDLNLNDGTVEQLAKVSARVGQDLQNYNKSYSRVITESMYLYKGSLVGGNNQNSRDLSMYLTYKIVVKNSGKVSLDVGYLVDHYDSYYLQWKQEDQNRIKTIVGAENCTAIVTPNDDGNHTGGHPYKSDKKELAASEITNMYNEVFIKVGKLNPSETKTMTITFEQQKDPKHGRLKINQDLQTGALLIGDKNVVEIDGYSSTENNIFQRGLITRHSNIGNLCPADFYGEKNKADGKNNKKAGGLIDDKDNAIENRVEVDTAAGPNLVIYIPTKGYIPCISGYTFEDIRNTSVEKAVIGNGTYAPGDKDLRDEHDTDKKIKGVTVQLVELVQEINSYGLSNTENANFIREKIWGTTEFKLDDYMGTDKRRGVDSTIYVPNTTAEDNRVHRYYSGTDKAQIILNVKSDDGNGYLDVQNKVDEGGKSYIALDPESGMYKFVNVPPGVFVVRFIYGDTTQTMLVKNTKTEGNVNYGNEVNELLGTKAHDPKAELPDGKDESEIDVINYESSTDDQYMFLKYSDGYISKEGLNEKSYNGNDYKSTIYQASLEQEGSYKGVNNYQDFEKQNYTNVNGYEMTQVTDDNDLERLYYYNTSKADSMVDHGISDAKDIYAFRQNSDNYSKGYFSSLTGTLKDDHLAAQNKVLSIENVTNEGVEGENPITLRNYRNEILNSFEQIGTYTSQNVKPENVEANADKLDAERQVAMLKELMKYTRMVAQTGIINFEVEYTVNDWGSAHDSDHEYVPLSSIYNGTPANNNLPSSDYVNNNEREQHYHIKDLNLGLVERPEAQVRINKNAANVKIVLSNGESLFDTNKSVNNMYYAKHKAHTYNYSSGYRLRSTAVSQNTLGTPELIQAYMDDELIENSTLEVKYVFTMENVGEVDYLDKQFYYTGKPISTALENISRTNIDEVLDYVPNKITFNADTSNKLEDLRVNTGTNETLLKDAKSYWQVKTIIPPNTNDEEFKKTIKDTEGYYNTYIYPFGVSTIDAQREQTPINAANPIAEGNLTKEYLYGLGEGETTGAAAGNLNADLVNREYFDRITSYSNGSILTTDRLSTKKYSNKEYYSSKQQNGEKEAYTFGLVPKVVDKGKKEDYMIETPLVLSVIMSRDDDLVYPNLIEAVRVSNSVGRRCKYSTVGNQPMANQNYENSKSSSEGKNTKLDKYSVYSPVDVVTPLEIDADSSQSVRVLPPTGFNKNNSNLYFALIGGFAIILVSILIIKISFEQRKNKKKANISRWK